MLFPKLKLLHRIIPCNELLHRYRLIDSPRCNWCPLEDDIPHFFITCSRTVHLWEKIWRYFVFVGLLNNVQIKNADMLVGCFHGFNVKQRLLINIVSMFTKFYIHRQKLFHQGICNYEGWFAEFQTRI